MAEINFEDAELQESLEKLRWLGEIMMLLTDRSSNTTW